MMPNQQDTKAERRRKRLARKLRATLLEIDEVASRIDNTDAERMTASFPRLVCSNKLTEITREGQDA